jgi:hypothetical protein
MLETGTGILFCLKPFKSSAWGDKPTSHDINTQINLPFALAFGSFSLENALAAYAFMKR